MKKYLLALLIIGSSFNAFSQSSNNKGVIETDTTQIKEKRNELKVNAAYLLGAFPEITYERMLNEEAAFGISVAFSLDPELEYKWSILPYYRIYFSKQQARGFFIEGNGVLFSANPYYYDSYYNGSQYKSSVQQGLGLGFAAGGKFITKRGWVGEIYLGVIRNFKNKKGLDDTYPRIGVTVGKRF